MRKKKYKGIKKSDRTKRISIAYNKNPILDFLTEISKQNNPEKVSIDFSKESMKMILTNECCQIIEQSDLSKMNMEYPEVFVFLKDILRIP